MGTFHTPTCTLHSTTAHGQVRWSTARQLRSRLMEIKHIHLQKEKEQLEEKKLIIKRWKVICINNMLHCVLATPPCCLALNYVGMCLALYIFVQLFCLWNITPMWELEMTLLLWLTMWSSLADSTVTFNRLDIRKAAGDDNINTSHPTNWWPPSMHPPGSKSKSVTAVVKGH